VFVLPARNPVHVAKILASAACLSGNRIALGAGMGWMPEEFRIGEQPFEQRGKRADEMIEVMRKLWSGEWVEHHGEFYDFAPVKMRPVPATPIPIYVGGLSEIALRRAARHDGGGAHRPHHEASGAGDAEAHEQRRIVERQMAQAKRQFAERHVDVIVDVELVDRVVRQNSNPQSSSSGMDGTFGSGGLALLNDCATRTTFTMPAANPSPKPMTSPTGELWRK